MGAALYTAGNTPDVAGAAAETFAVFAAAAGIAVVLRASAAAVAGVGSGSGGLGRSNRRELSSAGTAMLRSLEKAIFFGSIAAVGATGCGEAGATAAARLVPGAEAGARLCITGNGSPG
jgi:hypothetical protein